MEAAADQVTMKTEDVDTEEVVDSEEKIDGSSSKCSSMLSVVYTYSVYTSFPIMNADNVITINLVLHCNMFQKILLIGLELKRRIQMMITMVSSYC